MSRSGDNVTILLIYSSTYPKYLLNNYNIPVLFYELKVQQKKTVKTLPS